jgi:hypothetical protein
MHVALREHIPNGDPIFGFATDIEDAADAIVRQRPMDHFQKKLESTPPEVTALCFLIDQYQRPSPEIRKLANINIF